MLASAKLPKGRSTLRKLTPAALLPAGSALRRFSAEEVQCLRRRLAETLECVFDPRFRSKATARLMSERERELLDNGAVVARELDANGLARTLSADEEQTLFFEFNYFRYVLMKLLRKYAGQRLSSDAAARVVELDKLIRGTRDAIVEANLGLVPTMVQRARASGADFSELISEGHLALLRSVDKFDCARGFKFSTYACRSILTSITRSVAGMARYRAVFPAEFDPNLQRGDEVDIRRSIDDAISLEALKSALKSNDVELTATERRVLAERFGIKRFSPMAGSGNQKTLRQVAETFGVTKERVRQIQNRALAKLRTAIDAQLFTS